ncbi:MAG TPA: response regulator transcription factor [Flavobacteriales bacterium]
MSHEFLVADDHVIVRRGLRNLLHDQFAATEVAEVSTCKELLDHLKSKEPDLLILDLQMTDGSALDHLERICADHPGMKVLVYTMRSEKVYAQRVLALGAVGYLSKESDEAEVVRAIRRVLQGKEYISASTEVYLMEKVKDDETLIDPFKLLSDREIGVMEDLLAGLGVKDISMRLGVQPTTVATYKARLFDKLGVTNVLDLQRLVSVHRHGVD